MRVASLFVTDKSEKLVINVRQFGGLANFFLFSRWRLDTYVTASQLMVVRAIVCYWGAKLLEFDVTIASDIGFRPDGHATVA